MCAASAQVKEVKPNIRLRTHILFEPRKSEAMSMERLLTRRNKEAAVEARHHDEHT